MRKQSYKVEALSIHSGDSPDSFFARVMYPNKDYTYVAIYDGRTGDANSRVLVNGVLTKRQDLLKWFMATKNVVCEATHDDEQYGHVVEINFTGKGTNP